jgi:hypothetical protein
MTLRRMLGWDDLRQRGERRSKSQIRRAIHKRKFPPPAGYNGQSPFWTDEQLDAHIEQLIAEHASKVEA